MVTAKRVVMVILGIIVLILLSLLLSNRLESGSTSSVLRVNPVVRIDSNTILDPATGGITKSLPGTTLLAVAPIRDRHYVFTSDHMYVVSPTGEVEIIAEPEDFGVTEFTDADIDVDDGEIIIVVVGPPIAPPADPEVPYVEVPGIIDEPASEIIITEPPTPVPEPTLPEPTPVPTPTPPVDTEAPVIVLVGSSPVYLLVGEAYVEEGAIAVDGFDGDITSSIVITGVVDTSAPGTYIITYTVTDAAGYTSTVERTVIVTALPVSGTPIITITGFNPITAALGLSYVDAGATASDPEDGDITGEIAATSDVDTGTVGIYSVVYEVTDGDGNTATSTRVVEVAAEPSTTCTTVVASTDGSLIYFLTPTGTVTVDPGDYIASTDTSPPPATSPPLSPPPSLPGDPGLPVFTASCTCVGGEPFDYCLPKMPDDTVYPFPIPSYVPTYAGEGYIMCGTICGGFADLIESYFVTGEASGCDSSSSPPPSSSPDEFTSSPSATTIAADSTAEALCATADLVSTVYCASLTTAADSLTLSAASSTTVAATSTTSSSTTLYTATVVPTDSLTYTYVATAEELSTYLVSTAPFLTIETGTLTLVAYRLASDPSMYEAVITSACESDLTFTTLTTTVAMTRDEFLAYIADPSAPGVVVTTVHLSEGTTFFTGSAPSDSYVYMKADAGPCLDASGAFVVEPCPTEPEPTPSPTPAPEPTPAPTCTVAPSGLTIVLGTSGCVGIDAAYAPFQCHSYVDTGGKSVTACDSAVTDFGCSAVYPNQLMRMDRACTEGCTPSAGVGLAPVAGTSLCAKLGGSVDAEGFSYYTSPETGGFTSKFDDGMTDYTCGTVGTTVQLLKQDVICEPSAPTPEPAPAPVTCEKVSWTPGESTEVPGTSGCSIFDTPSSPWQAHTYTDATGKVIESGISDSGTTDYFCTSDGKLHKHQRKCSTGCYGSPDPIYGFSAYSRVAGTSDCETYGDPLVAECFKYKSGGTFKTICDDNEADYSCAPAKFYSYEPDGTPVLMKIGYSCAPY